MTSIWIMALVRNRLILENPVSVLLIACRNIVCRGLRQRAEMQFLSLSQIRDSVNMCRYTMVFFPVIQSIKSRRSVKTILIISRQPNSNTHPAQSRRQENTQREVLGSNYLTILHPKVTATEAATVYVVAKEWMVIVVHTYAACEIHIEIVRENNTNHTE